MNTLTHHTNIVAEHIHATHRDGAQTLVAIAGPPGSGKSTLATQVARRLTEQRTPAIVVPMDGFHLDNAILEARGIKHLKGAPQTFDVAGLIRKIKALKDDNDVYFPRFDRAQDQSIAGAIAVDHTMPVVIIEGNYLMYDAPVWADLALLWDITIRLDVPLPDLRARLIQRWLSLNHSSTAATRRAEENDLPNVKDVIARALPCDLTLRIDPQG